MPAVLAARPDSVSTPKYGILHPQQSQIDAMKGTAAAFMYIFSGDIGEAMSLLLVGGAIYIVGTFLLIYYIIIFVMKTTLIKGDEHKGVRNGIAIGFALLGTATPQVYKTTVTFLGGTGLMAILLLFIVYSVIVMIKGYKAANSEGNAAAYKNKAEAYRAKAEMNKEKGASERLEHDEDRETNLVKNEALLIDRSENALNEELKDASDMNGQLMAIRKVLGYLAGVRDSTIAGEQRKNVARRASAFTEQLKAGEAEVVKAQQLLVTLQKLEFTELKLEKDEYATLGLMRKNLMKELKDFHKIAKVSDPKYKALQKEFTIFEPDLAKQLHLAHDLDLRREELLKAAKDSEAKITSQYEDIKSSQEEMVNALNLGTQEGIRRAIVAVDNSIRLESHIAEEIAANVNLVGQQATLTEDKNEIDRRVKAIINNIRAISV